MITRLIKGMDMKEQLIKDTLNGMRERYRNDSDVLSAIEREEQDLKYILDKEDDSEYKGQTALQHLRMFQAHIEYWN